MGCEEPLIHGFERSQRGDEELGRRLNARQS
jgi:hypothetical protein